MMKAKASKFTALKLKALFISCTIIGFVGFTQCQAQSVVGTWKRTATNWFTIDKATGKEIPVSAEYKKQVDEHMASVGYKEVLEFKPDHTYVSTLSTNDNSKGTAHTGSWSLSGNELKTTDDKKGTATFTVKSVNSNTMILD